MEFKKWIEGEEDEGLIAMSQRHLSTDDLSTLHKKHGKCGLCFPFALGLAGEALNDSIYPDNEILVVHGIFPLGGEHAWVEMGGMAYDWQTRQRKEHPLSIEEFYKKHNPTNIKKYPAAKALGMAIRQKNHGPWE